MSHNEGSWRDHSSRRHEANAINVARGAKECGPDASSSET